MVLTVFKTLFPLLDMLTLGKSNCHFGVNGLFSGDGLGYASHFIRSFLETIEGI